jgi:hypothetical protein
MSFMAHLNFIFLFSVVFTQAVFAQDLVPGNSPTRPAAAIPLPVSGNRKAVRRPGEITSVESLKDPLHSGNALYVGFTQEISNQLKRTSSSVEFSHTWNTQLVSGITVPEILTQSGYPDTAASAPRLGGGTFDRVTLNSVARLWGNAASYLNLEFLVGLPFQTDDKLKKTNDESFLFGGVLSGRFAFHPFALEFSFTDANELPHEEEGTNTYYDSTNTINWNVDLDYLITNRAQLQFVYAETPPTHSDHGTDNTDYAYLLGNSSAVRTRSFGLAFDYVFVPEHLLGLFGGSYLTDASEKLVGSTSWSARLKWVF